MKQSISSQPKNKKIIFDKKFFTNNLTLLIILSAIWGSAFIAIKISVEFVNPISIASLRLIIASFFLLIIFFYKKYVFNLNLKISHFDNSYRYYWKYYSLFF